MRALLVTSAEKGHLNPVVGVAQWLQELGHHVGWLTLPDPSPQLEAIGVEPVRAPGLPPAPPLTTGGEALARLVTRPDALRGWIRTLLIEAVPAQVEPVGRAIAAFRPDVIALDGMLYQAVIAAHRAGVPYAGISSALTLLEPPELDTELLRTVRGLAGERASLFARFGMEPAFRTCECLSPSLNVVFATPAFVGEGSRVPPNTRLVGPSAPLRSRGDETDFPWDRLPADRPLVYASFGSQIYWQPELLQTIAVAAADLGVGLAISAGELADTGFGDRLPGCPVVRRYVPQLAVLERAAVLVTHGGANSVMESLRCGVPQLLVPICNDQFVQAFFAERAGTGIAVSPAELSRERCRESLAALLDAEGPQRRAARRVAEHYAHRDGAREAAEAIAALAG